MTLQKLKLIISKIPKEYDEFEVVCSEYETLDEQSEYTARLDKPIFDINVDTKSKEILLVNKQA